MRRGSLDIMADVLKIAKHGAKPTHIQYRGNLNHKQLKGYLGLLQALGLLRKNGGCFEATVKGVEYLRDYRKLQGHLQPRKTFPFFGVNILSRIVLI